MTLFSPAIKCSQLRFPPLPLQYRGVDVAVKMLRNDFTEEQLTSFYDEAEVISRVPPHQYIVGVRERDPLVFVLCDAGSSDFDLFAPQFLGCVPDPFMIITGLASFWCHFLIALLLIANRVAEFCGQGSLKRFLRSPRTQNLSTSQALKVCADVGEGMAHLAKVCLLMYPLFGALCRDLSDFGVISTKLSIEISRHATYCSQTDSCPKLQVRESCLTVL
jgi:serine/threonine protein kinase